jgi:hypothetical protein
MMTDPKQNKILIEGETEEGQTFRPSDWAERMSGSLSTFRGHRMIYSPLLQPVVKNGQKCLLLDPELKKTNPALYDAIMEFAKSNKLKMHDED